MTALAAACLALLEAEAGHLPLSAASLSRVLWCYGDGTKGRPYTPAEVEVAMQELMNSGHVEREWRRGRMHYRHLLSRDGATSQGSRA